MKLRSLFLALLVVVQLTSFNIYSTELFGKESNWEPIIRTILIDLFGNGTIEPMSSPKLPDPNNN